MHQDGTIFVNMEWRMSDQLSAAPVIPLETFVKRLSRRSWDHQIKNGYHRKNVVFEPSGLDISVDERQQGYKRTESKSKFFALGCCAIAETCIDGFTPAECYIDEREIDLAELQELVASKSWESVLRSPF